MTMPRLERMVATIKSMIRKGKSTKNPIENAVLSSDIANAGTAIRRGTSASVSGRGASETS